MSILLAIIRNLIPEFIAASIVGWIGIDRSDLILSCGLFLICALLLRISWNSSILIHGLGHVLLTAIVDRDPHFIKATNILEHRTPASILKSLIPFQPIFSPFQSNDYPWVGVGKITPLAIRIKALGGSFFNAIAIGLIPLLISPSVDLLRINNHLNESMIQLVITIFVGANTIVILSSLSDLVAVVTGEATCFNCGNFGFVGKRLASDGDALLPGRFVEIFHTMGGETEIRGEQAGGGVTFARDRSQQVVFVGTKVVNKKRQNLTQSLEQSFAPVRQKAARAGAKAVADAVVGVWHYRYATSSPPAIIETHWHEWMPARFAAVWRVERGQWVCDRQSVNHRITHNGDFDAWILFGEQIENADLGLWLARVLHTPNAALGDSPKIAGMMDLLITQGMWDASLRLAYQLEVAKSIEEAFDGKQPDRSAPNTAPSVAEIQAWAAIVEGVFLNHKDTVLLPHANSMLELSKPQVDRLEQDILQALKQHNSIGQWTIDTQTAFVRTAIHVFFHHNLYQATKLFMSRAKGSFGLITASTLSEASLVLSAWGQPISTGFNVEDEYMVYASEPAAVDAVLSAIPRSYRLDLEQKSGEIAWVGVDQITIYSMAEDRELLGSELEQRWIPLQGNAYILPPATNAPDPVEYDIQQIPQVLQALSTSWRDPASFNCQSAEYLVELLLEKAKSWDQRQRATINIKLDRAAEDKSLDILITGVESSLWLGERFAQDLGILFPALRIGTISANQVLRKLQSDVNRLHLGKNSIVLAISQSGQTFPTLQATHAFEQLRREGGIGEMFLLTGEICSLMGTAISQYYYPNSSFTRRIFVNGSGRRTAEPTTVAISAAHVTLTELFLYLAKRLRQSFPGQNGPLGMTLTVADLETLDRVKDDFLDRSVIPIVGTKVNGDRIHSTAHEYIKRSSQTWAGHVLETPLVWGIHALYVLITVGLNVPLVQTLFRLIFASVQIPIPGLLLPLLVFADILIYIFGPWLWTLGLRFVQGRPLFARMGKRTLVIGDVNWVNNLLKIYVSKLFSLSYGIASLEVHGGNPQDHMLHHYGHRVIRGTLVFLGIPDGRRDRLQKENESAVIMTGKQASGVRNLTSGAEIIALGHNPTNAQQGFQDTIILPGESTAAIVASDNIVLEELRESRFSSFERLLASYVFFWALSKKVASFPLLKYQHWKSQSRTRIMTTAAPVSRGSDLPDRTG
jgi:hypothetical protein